jgi:hypothetical protein
MAFNFSKIEVSHRPLQRRTRLQAAAQLHADAATPVHA